MFLLYVLLYTLSGRPGGYPDVDFINKKTTSDGDGCCTIKMRQTRLCCIDRYDYDVDTG